MSSSRKSGSARERTQLFANIRPYASSDAMTSQQMDNPFTSQTAGPSVQQQPQFTDAMYDQLESQHDEQFGVLSSKISLLKDISTRIGGEVKEGTGLLATLEERFDGTRVTVRNTMNRVIRTADKSGVSWRSWLVLFFIIIMCFWFVLFI